MPRLTRLIGAAFYKPLARIRSAAERRTAKRLNRSPRGSRTARSGSLEAAACAEDDRDAVARKGPFSAAWARSAVDAAQNRVADETVGQGG